MAENSPIEWTDHTFNPWIGCTKVSPGCDNCYAAVSTPARAMRVEWGAGAQRHRTAPSTWGMPKRWNDRHAAFFAQHGRRQRVFCASLADVFDNQVPTEWRRDLFDLIELTPDLDWLLLTKRIGNVADMVREARSWDWMLGRSNVWLGATIVNQEEADRDIPKLLATPARVRFLSCEPLLGPVDLTNIHISGHGHHEFEPKVMANMLKRPTAYPPLPQVHWVIVGGESGPNARAMHPDWARSLRNQCAAAGVPFLFKQWGEWIPGHVEDPADGNSYWEDEYGTGVDVEGRHRTETIDGVAYCHVGKKAAGRLLDGRTHDQFPEAA